eukprot:CAMPEP_0194141320 /NCGR_PEP_ID=MMETSP0152-20130528/10734_1 /TAXON_ID=1049557 /ORGANISM="Thalassiothrix antarctica, Strain L6-D1" /LENGTH=867 /DNA_ID=CAMNT_0038839895 /DNA_START=35 /DNA_END=2638 /DNA_ORIENTATION=+
MTNFRLLYLYYIILFLLGNNDAFMIIPSTSSRILHNNHFFVANPSGSTALHVSTEEATTTIPNYNSVMVAKEGGVGARSASQQAAEQNLSLGAPPPRPRSGTYETSGGLEVQATVTELAYGKEGSVPAIENMIDQLDSHKGVLLASSYEFPGRYARWSLGFVDPPLEISGRGQDCTILALNDRGRLLLPSIRKVMERLQTEDKILESVESDDDGGIIRVRVVPPSPVGTFAEEERSRQPSLFSVVRALIELFSFKGDDAQLGFYGGFGYDLTFQFEPIELSQQRDPEQRDLLLYLPDQILVVDQDKHDAWTVSYEFGVKDGSTTTTTEGIERVGLAEPFQPYDEDKESSFISRDTPEGEFASSVEKAKGEFAVGNLFEAVLSQTFREKLDENTPPSVLFRRLRSRNPSPYGFMINLGEQEYLVGASPEMFVRCESTMQDGKKEALRVETCPISGTVARGADALEDAQRVKSLIMNAKEESELTMCTDVDRNDKSRICQPGSVKVIGRRQIEMYSRLIHTVDHVEGYLRKEFDALDAFLCHTWAVTVTGAPKTWAIQFVEENERSQRCWYGGAVGMVGFDGSMNTGLTLRTVRVKDGAAEVRAGATLLYDSDPPAEEKETELKASALIDAIVRAGPEDTTTSSPAASTQHEKVPVRAGDGKNVVLIDHEDSFVHTLGNYLRQTGASVQTLRSGPFALSTISEMSDKPDLVILSPGPGNPKDFELSKTLDFLIENEIPAFGVCLGLQGMVEHFGGELGVLGYPMHGKPSMVSLTDDGRKEQSIFAGLPDTFEVARYHSLYGVREKMPSCLSVTAVSTEDNIIMGIEHKSLPLGAVQFHPESILTSPKHGIRLLENALRFLSKGGELENK